MCSRRPFLILEILIHGDSVICCPSLPSTWRPRTRFSQRSEPSGSACWFETPILNDTIAFFVQHQCPVPMSLHLPTRTPSGLNWTSGTSDTFTSMASVATCTKNYRVLFHRAVTYSCARQNLFAYTTHCVFQIRCFLFLSATDNTVLYLKRCSSRFFSIVSTTSAVK